MRTFIRLTVLTAMTLLISAAGAEAQLCSNSCYISCRNADRFCRDNPNGYWSNGYAGGACADFGGTDACCKWECPNTTPTFSRCVQNPNLSGCQSATDPVQQYCSDTYQESCLSQCNAAVASLCPSGGRCASSVISSPVGYQCSCTYTVECY
jgi:hypothetical protein